MAAVGDRQVVLNLHCRHGADADGFLSLAEVCRPLDESLHEQLLDLFLEEPDFEHLAQPLDPPGIGELNGCLGLCAAHFTS